MSALLLMARGVVRQRVGALVGLALLLAVGLGGSIAAFTAAWRTDHAYPEYLHRNEVNELVVNPSLLTDRAAEVIASTPGVIRVATDSMLTATADAGAPRTRSDIDSQATQVRASTNGRYVEVDRPVVHEGRMIHSGAEAFVSLEAAEDFGVEVGDEIPLSFWMSGYSDARQHDPAEIVEPIGTVAVKVVGIGAFADEVLVDGLYPRQRILVTAEVVAPYDCTPAHPAADDARSLDEIGPELAPEDCALSYRYFSLRVEGGDAGVARVVDDLIRRFDAENELLPEVLLAQDVSFTVIPAVTSVERDQIQRSLAPSVTALALFGVGAASATLALAVLATFRSARRSQTDATGWRQLGATRNVVVAALALPLIAAVLAGLAGAVVIGWCASGLGPVASARVVRPGTHLGLPGTVVAAVTAASLLILIAGVLASSVLASRRLSAVSSRPSRLTTAAARISRVPVALGVRAAVGSAGDLALVAGGIAAVTAVVASVMFSTNLSTLVAQPQRFGWPYDAAVVVGFGYGGADRAQIAETLDRPEVERWGIASLGNATIDNVTVPVVASRSGFADMPLPLVRGSLPTGDDELALGTRTADRLGVGIGDSVAIASAYGEATATVSGLVVMPPVGSFLADRASLGTGALLSAGLLETMMAFAEETAGVPAGSFADGSESFVVIDLRDGVDAETFLAGLGDELGLWSLDGYFPFVHAEPVRPAQIADVAAMRSAPVLLAAFISVAMGVGLALAVGLAARNRRRELAVLRALGATSAQLGATVHWQALTVVGVGLVIGTPVGLLLGTITWHAFAGGLGIRDAPIVSTLWISVVVVGAIALALLASAGPSRYASRVAPSTVLRES